MYPKYFKSFTPIKRCAHVANACLLGCSPSFGMGRLSILQLAHYSKAKGGDSKKPPSAPTGKLGMRIVPVVQNKLNYDEKNMKLGRALSPHLTIYRKQLTSMMSIFLRASGATLGLAVWIIGLTALLCKLDINALAEKVEGLNLGGVTFTALKFILMVPFSYHVMAGTRHLIWYLNMFLTKPEIYTTGYVAIAMSLLLAAALALISVKPPHTEPQPVLHDKPEPKCPVVEEDPCNVPDTYDECEEPARPDPVRPDQKGCGCED
ncbi:uncharacterized protein LOC108651917 [Drosophila navojoa]|uniref:uncharacterized protein LOC108651917 n=1 Tax=Drosophila navojoa TaxID=7232 RepID=UPI0011BF8378|nr:uncharacterized protein LOC108651917 [Drosophila navojoa]